MNVKLLIGQCVEFCPMGGLAGRYHVLRVVPVEAHHEEPCYRIRGELKGDQWVVTECNLDGNVGTAQHYERIAQQFRDLRQRRAPGDVSTESLPPGSFGEGGF